VSEQFTALAPHLQVIVGVLTVSGAGIWGVIKFFKPFIDNVHKTPLPSAKSTDAVVISAALADSKFMTALSDSIDKLCESQDEANKHAIKRAIIDEMLLEAITRLIHKP
jgi:formaldehyde-activating enzyme involved in methanogenesis